MGNAVGAGQRCVWLVVFVGGMLAAGLVGCSPRRSTLAYVDTARLMVGFSEAATVQRELKEEDDKWRAQLTEIQDSVQAVVDAVSKEFDKAKPARKRQLQDMLSARNQQMNNFVQANQRRLDELRKEKMKSVRLSIGQAAGTLVFEGSVSRRRVVRY